MAGPKLPTVDSVTTINKDGSRYMLHPADVEGKFTLWRRIFAVVLLAVYVLLPWIPIKGHPAVFLDTLNRKFHLFGLTFVAQDLWLGFFVVTGIGFSLFYITSLFGRLWCGWACPYTVFLEHVFRRIERLIDGDAANRRKLDEAPWDFEKKVRRIVKHTLYILAAAVIAHVFLSYFVSLPQLWQWMGHSPKEHWFAFTVVMFLTGVLYFCFAWFREQFCIIMCPYGRLQSALTDDNTMVVGYDKVRGEPRGKAGTTGAGDCINCLRCVQVCPTGIDIRNGLQLECIGCSACIDACDTIMKKLDRKPGLVRYDSLNGLKGTKTRWIRPRTVVYSIIMGIGATALLFGLSKLEPMTMNLTRMQGMPYYINDETQLIRNQMQVRVVNKQETERTVSFSLDGAPAGTKLTGPEENLVIKADSEEKYLLLIEIPYTSYKGRQPLVLKMTTQPGNSVITQKFEFTGPDATLLKIKPVTP
jgi:cytochrome c oxidase accessory protein FixG